MADRGPGFITALLHLYRRLGPAGSGLEVTVCVSPLLQLVPAAQSALLEPVLDPLFNTLFQQVCIPMDFERPNTVKNHNEILRCYDTMMRHSPEKLVAGLLAKADSGEERLRVGALTVIKHLLNMSTEELGEQLEAILAHLAGKLGEGNPAVQRVLAQIVVMLGGHGAITGPRGRDLVDFIIRLCCQEEGPRPAAPALEPLATMCGNILQLLATSVPSAEEVLWPHTMDCLLQPDCDQAAPAVARALALIAGRRAGRGEELAVDWGDFRHCAGPSPLLARLLVLASVPAPGGRGQHVLRFLLRFSASINRHLAAVWEARFPLLLHYLEQPEAGQDAAQWQDWLLDLVTDSARQVEMEDWTLGLCNALVGQLALYPAASREKSFSIRCVGRLLTLVTNKQAVLDHLSSIFLATVDRRQGEAECALAFGSVAAAHLDLVLSKCGALYTGQAVRKNTSFFGLIRDREGEESQARVIAIVLQCIGQAAVQARPAELEACVEPIVKSFLLPCLQDPRAGPPVREAVLAAVSEVASALRAVLAANPAFKLARHEELLHSAIAVLQVRPQSILSPC
jgi:hypothetical protein